MKKKSFCLLLLTAVLLFCAACGQTQTEQPEDTGDKDQYMTEPVPDGKPDPVEPQDTSVDTTTTHTSVAGKTIPSAGTRNFLFSTHLSILSRIVSQEMEKVQV